MKKLKAHLPFLTGALLLGILVLGLFRIYQSMSLLSNQVKIGATYMTMNNEFYQILNEEIEQKVTENNDLLITRDPALDANKQAEQVNYFIKEGVDVIIINPVDSDSSALLGSLKKAHHKGIRIVVVDSQLNQADFVDTTILSDNYEAGVLCAQNLMANKDKAKILLLEHRSTESASDRIRGFLDTVAKNDAYQVVSRVDVQGQTELALPAVREVIKSGVIFDTVMSLNDQGALGAVAAIEEAGLTNHILVYGIDGSPNMKSLLATTTDVQATVAQSPHSIGQEAIKSAYQLTKGQSCRAKIVIPVELITKDTIGQYDVTGWQ
ncbi:substrate-binding domain-containing protein [Streptococcus dentiloxodontae]